MRRFLFVSLLTVAITFSSVTAHAAIYTCGGLVLQLSLTPNGLVVVTVGGGGTPILDSVYVCQIGATYNVVSPEVCKVLYETLLEAKKHHLHIQWWFDNELSCAEHPAWSPLTGAYFGPQIL